MLQVIEHKQYLLAGLAEGTPIPVLRAAKQVAQETEGSVRLEPLLVVLVPLLELCRLQQRGRQGMSQSLLAENRPFS